MHLDNTPLKPYWQPATMPRCRRKPRRVVIRQAQPKPRAKAAAIRRPSRLRRELQPLWLALCTAMIPLLRLGRWLRAGIWPAAFILAWVVIVTVIVNGVRL